MARLLASMASVALSTVPSSPSRAAEPAEGMPSLPEFCAVHAAGGVDLGEARAAAQALHARARNTGDAGADAAATALDAKVAAMAGDYGVALRIARTALDSPALSADATRELKSAFPAWIVEQHAQSPWAFLYDEEIRVRLPDWPPEVPAPRGPCSGVYRIASDALGESATLAISRTDGSMTGQLLQTFASGLESECSSGRCRSFALGSIAQLHHAAGDAAGAASRYAAAAAAALEAGDRNLAARMLFAQGDALAAPESSIAELDFPTQNPVRVMLAARAGTSEATDPAQREAILRDAEAIYARAVDLGGASGAAEVEARARRGFLDFARGKADEASREFRTAARLHQARGELIEAWRCSAAAFAAAVSAHSGSDAEAETLTRALAEHEAVGTAIGSARLLSAVAASAARQGDIPAALSALDGALRLAAGIEATQVEADLLLQKAEVLADVGRRQESATLKRAAPLLRTRYEEVIPRLRIFRARSGADKELRMFRTRAAAEAYSLVADLFAVGDLTHAREQNQRLAELIRRGADPRVGLAQGPVALDVLVERSEGQFLLAEDRHDEAARLARRIHDPLLEAAALLGKEENSAAASVTRAFRDDALVALRAADAGGGLGQLRFQDLRSRLEWSVQLLLRCGLPDEARRTMETADLEWSAKNGRERSDWLFVDSQAPWRREAVLAEIAERDRDFSAAAALLRKAVTGIRERGNSVGNVWEREGFDLEHADLERSFVRVLLEQGRVEDAIVQLETARARTFHSQLLASSTDPAVADLLRQWWTAGAELESFRRDAAAGLLPPDDPRIASTAARVEDLARRLREKGAPMPGVPDDVPAELPRVVADALRRPAPTAAIAYFISRERSGAWVIRPEAPLAFRFLPTSGPQLRSALARMSNVLDPPQELWKPAARKLYDLLLLPIADLLPGKTRGGPRPRLYVVPHGPLDLVPFAALVDHQGRTQIERFDFVRAPSVRSILRTSPSSFQSLDRRVGAIGFNTAGLTAAEAEARAIGGSEARVGPQATRAALQDAGLRSGIVHIAAHATLDERNPFRSRLVLADGVVSLKDILSSPWRSRIVTLSACQTAGGTATAAGEITGLARAFLVSGVQTVVVAGWRIADASTAELMRDFYARLATADPAAALGGAQRDFASRRDEYAHPAFWAPFSLLGSDR